MGLFITLYNYRLVHWKVSFIQRCPLFRVSLIIKGSTAYNILYRQARILDHAVLAVSEKHNFLQMKIESKSECFGTRFPRPHNVYIFDKQKNKHQLKYLRLVMGSGTSQ